MLSNTAQTAREAEEIHGALLDTCTGHHYVPHAGRAGDLDRALARIAEAEMVERNLRYRDAPENLAADIAAEESRTA